MTINFREDIYYSSKLSIYFFAGETSETIFFLFISLLNANLLNFLWCLVTTIVTTCSKKNLELLTSIEKIIH